MLTKPCLACGVVIKKPVNESLKNWNERHKYCSKTCSATHRMFGEKTRFKTGHPFGDRFKKGEHYSVTTEFKVGHATWNKGLKGYMAGEKNAMWRGGVTPEHARLRRTAEYKAWRVAVFTRDNYTCQICGKRGGNLQADHIKPFAFYPELRHEVSNGRTLCRSCHLKTPTHGKGSYAHRLRP